MQLRIDIAKGKIRTNSDKIRDYISSCDDGAYIFSIIRINPLVTERDYQKAYFDMVDTAVEATGNPRYTIHDEFKKHCDIESTKNLDIVGWRDLLSKFRWWAYEMFDCIV